MIFLSNHHSPMSFKTSFLNDENRILFTFSYQNNRQFVLTKVRGYNASPKTHPVSSRDHLLFIFVDSIQCFNIHFSSGSKNIVQGELCLIILLNGDIFWKTVEKSQNTKSSFESSMARQILIDQWSPFITIYLHFHTSVYFITAIQKSS